MAIAFEEDEVLLADPTCISCQEYFENMRAIRVNYDDVISLIAVEVANPKIDVGHPFEGGLVVLRAVRLL